MKLILLLLTLTGNALCKSQQNYRDTILEIHPYIDTIKKFHVAEYVDLTTPHLDNPTIVYGFKNPEIKKDTLYTGYNNQVYWGYFYNVREWHTGLESQTDRERTNLYIYGNFDPTKNEYWVHLFYLDANKLPLSTNVIVWQSILK